MNSLNNSLQSIKKILIENEQVPSPDKEKQNDYELRPIRCDISSQEIFDSKKEILLNKIREIELNTQSKIVEVKSYVDLIMRNTTKEAKRIEKALCKFLVVCSEIKSDIESKEYFTDFDFLCPIDSYLISKSQDIEKFEIKSPCVTMAPLPKIFEILLPLFPHKLYNHANMAISSKSPSSLYQFPSQKLISHKNISPGFKSLVVGEHQILITGGNFNDPSLIPKQKNKENILKGEKKIEPEDFKTNDTEIRESKNKIVMKSVKKVFKIDLSIQKISELADLNSGRIWHGMGWIRNKPCVIGGHSNTIELNTVEIYANNRWTFHEACMNYPRSSFSSVNFNNALWVVGGYHQVPIERFIDDQWEIIDLKLECLSSVGLISLGSTLLILGGANDGTFSSEIVKFDTYTHKIKSVTQKMRLSYFPFGGSFINDESIYLIDHQGLVQKFPTKEIFLCA